MTLATPTSVQERALTLLGQGIGVEQTASAIGVTPSAISQLLSTPEFSAKVADLRFKNLSKHNERDSRYDEMEDALLDKLKDLLPFMTRPMEVVRAIALINGAKRRGASAPESITNQQTVINLIIPTVAMQRFSLNSNNQVISAGTQDLITAQSNHLPTLLAKHKTAMLSSPHSIKELTHEPTPNSSSEASHAAS